ncbi:MAG: hypothetical protein U9Q66_02080 [Patescibacteria group bacterium]|nr:hypothetical protein [Patescibacteria group bacterium]
MLEHKENFELENKYEQIWDSIRYKKVDELYGLTEDVINILDGHIDDKLLFHSDYQKIQELFIKMKQTNFFYNSKSAKDIIKSVNPAFENVYTKKECVRELKYLGSDLKDKDFERGKIYQSTHFNGATYTFDINNKERVIGYTHFERLN